MHDNIPASVDPDWVLSIAVDQRKDGMMTPMTQEELDGLAKELETWIGHDLIYFKRDMALRLAAELTRLRGENEQLERIAELTGQIAGSKIANLRELVVAINAVA